MAPVVGPLDPPDDSLRRIANQAFFDKLYVQTDDQIDGKPDEPFNIFFNPDVQQLATTRQRAVETGTQTGQVVGLNNDQLWAWWDAMGNPALSFVSYFWLGIAGKPPWILIVKTLKIREIRVRESLGDGLQLL